MELLSILRTADPFIWSLLVLITANFLLAVMVAIKNRAFDLKKLADLYARDILPQIGGYLVIRLLIAGLGDTPLAATFSAAVESVAFGIIAAALLARIWAHLRELGLRQET